MRVRTIIAAAAAPLALTGIALSATAASASTTPTAIQLSAAHVWTAKTHLISRPDSGGAGNTWANDTMTRTLTIRLLGSTGSGASTVYYYSANVKDAGKFQTVNGALTPNQSGPYANETENGSVPGTISGSASFSFTATSLPNMSLVPKTVTGSADSTGTWYELAFPASEVTFGGAGLGNWGWHYNGPEVVTFDSSGKHVIAVVHERWADTASNNGGQLQQDGNINGLGN
jgi:hypothetical protein